MRFRMGLAMVVALASATAQTTTESNLSYRRFQDLQSTPEGVKAAELVADLQARLEERPTPPHGGSLLRGTWGAYRRNPGVA
jgi:hypothetical protein